MADAGGLYIVISPSLSLFFSASGPDSLPEDAPMNQARLLWSDLLQVFDEEYPPIPYDEAEGNEADQPGATNDDADESSSWRPIVLCSCWATNLAHCSFWLALLLLCS